ncbi:MAG: prephenate dehydratase [Leptospiraceae bacterium]|nr:prephenate dehydratase [Leptospiraceae bacterium]
MNNELENLRKIIDQLDTEIVEKIQERARIAKKIGEFKKENKSPIYRPDREKEVYEKIKSLNKGIISNYTLEAIYREIMSASFSVERGLKIAYLGPQGSFSHQAVRGKFGSSVETESYISISDVFSAVEKEYCDYGVVPVENSSEGLVNSTLDRFLTTELSLKIYSEIYMRVSLNLLGFETDISKVKKIYGIKIANSQCKNWINANLKHCEIIETSSTAQAAKIVSEQKEGVAIASQIAAEIYRLDVLYESIEDLSDNSTRFLIIGKSQSPPSGRDKTSIAFSLHDKPGVLYHILKEFNDNNINLTKIESRPTRVKVWDYNFFIDFYGHEKDPHVKIVLENLKEKTTYLRILGSYPVAENLI